MNDFLDTLPSETDAESALPDRNAFAATIPGHLQVLEIGPFHQPLLSGPNVRYFDVLPPEGLVSRAAKLGLDPSHIPGTIHYVSPLGDLSIVDRTFDFALSSHCLEHQPDLLGHLQSVGNLLTPGGAYYMMVPDQRYCFDHFMPVSNLAEVIVAHRERRTVHALRSLIENYALTTHNDSERHWRGDHGKQLDAFAARCDFARNAFEEAKGAYIDVHAWYFTPESAGFILTALFESELISFRPHRIYPTRYGSPEFWVVLRKGGYS